MVTTIEQLFAESKKTKKIQLQIEILTSISMVSDLPGSYYKSNRKPNKFQLGGLFENLIGLHIGLKTRKNLFKIIQKDWKKRFEIELKDDYSNSGFQPILFPLFEMDSFFVSPSLVSFDDLWKKSMRRKDDKTHPAGTPNLDASILPLKRKKAIEAGGKGAKLDDKDLYEIFKENIDKFPFYYTTLAKREYLQPIDISADETKRSFIFQLHCTAPFEYALSKAITKCSTAYLGHSESWIELKILSL